MRFPLRAEIVNLDKTIVVQRNFSENVAISSQRVPDTLARSGVPFTIILQTFRLY